MKQAHGAILGQVYADWLDRGWSIDALKSFRMEGEGNGGGGDGGAGSGSGSSGSDARFTQADLDRIAAREKDQGKRAAEEAIAAQLGVSLDEAKNVIADAKKRNDADKSEAQKARDAADREKAEAETAKQTAARERHQASVERALIRALPRDLDDTQLDARVSRMSRLIDVEVGADAATVKAAVDQLKKDMPELFPAAGNGTAKKDPPAGDPKGGPPKDKKPPEDAFNRGTERAKGVGTQSYDILKQLA